MEKDMIKEFKTHTEIDTSIEGIIQGAFDTTNIKEIPIEKINNFVQEYDKEMSRDLDNQYYSEGEVYEK
jgi:hypothetical protein